MCKNNCWKIRTSGKGVVLEIRTHPDSRGGGGLKIRDFAGVLCRRPLSTQSEKGLQRVSIKVEWHFLEKRFSNILRHANDEMHNSQI